MMLSGNLSDWSVGDLLQMLHITKKTASLHVGNADRSGVVYFDEGAIVNAAVSLGGSPKGDPRDEVVEAVYVLELLDEGTFEIKNEVPPRMIEPLVVAEALELAGQHLDAERRLDETGLLAALGLRLAQTIDEPIILSEQVWNAISVSIPVFTFPELEKRLGRAAAVSTVEQFRDLGILEAVLEELAPAPSAPIESMSPGDDGFTDMTDAFDDDVDSQRSDALADAWTPPAPEPVDEPWTPPAPEADEGSWMVPAPESEADVAPSFDADDSTAHESEPIVPRDPEEVRPIFSNAPDDSIVVPDESSVDESPAAEPDLPVSSGLTSAPSSLSAAIRAAAGTGPSDDEAQLLSEAATAGPDDAPATDDDGDGSLRRTVKSLVSPSPASSSKGGFGDLSARFRQAAAAESGD